jgi:alkylation response protein AidB-like acyl-CoA dehydrogenase
MKMTNKIDLPSLVNEIGPGFAEGTAERDHDAEFVKGNYDVLREHKVFSALVPTELGGGGASHSEMCTFVRELAHYCGSTALTLSMHQHLVAAAVYNHSRGNPGQALLEKVAGGELILVSTGANDWLESSGEVERGDGGYLVSARKAFASGSVVGNIAVTSAPYNDPTEGWQVLHFPVPIAAEGVSTAGDWDTMGMRATGSETLIFDNVFVPDEAVVLKRQRGAYHPAFNVILGNAMPLIMSAYLGVAEAAYELAKTQARKKIGDPTIPFMLGELTNHLTTAQIAVESMVAIADDGRFAPVTETADAILARKTIAAKAALATGEAALAVCGGIGFHRKFGLERMLRDLHGGNFHPLPEKRQQLFSGRVALGLDPVATDAADELRQAAE